MENSLSGLYGTYLFVADILAAFVLVGFAYAIYRRTVVKPAYLTMGMDANLIILFTCLIIITFQFINAFQSLLPVEPGAYDYRGVFPISVLLFVVLQWVALVRNALGSKATWRGRAYEAKVA